MNPLTTTAVAILVVAATACGDGASPRTAPPADLTTTTFVHPTWPATTPASEPSIFPPEPLPGSGSANGSGCTIGPGTLPDGVWAGFVAGHEASRIDFDVACFFFGDIAEEMAAREGGEAPSGHYISNLAGTVRRVDLDPATPVRWLVAPPDADLRFETSPYADWAGDPEGYSNCPGELCLVWLRVEGGAVTEITEQYLP